MIRLETDSIGWVADANGESLTLRTKRAREIAESVEQGKRYTVEIKEYSERRSRNANNFMWSLLSQCADILRTTKEELYIQYVRKIGPYKDFTLTEDEARTFSVAWSRIGTGWPTERVDFDGDNVVIRAYYGSSTYTKKRMSRLIDMVVEDAKEIGVDCMTEKERALLIDKWEPVKV